MATVADAANGHVSRVDSKEPPQPGSSDGEPREPQPNGKRSDSASSAKEHGQKEKGKDAEPNEKPKPMSRRTKILIAVGVVIVAMVGLGYYIHSRGYEDTDDAEIDGNISSISSRVQGTVIAVRVEENQEVRAGDVLLELDPADLDVAVKQAKAKLAEAEAELEAEHPNLPIVVTTNETSAATAGSDVHSSVASFAAARAEVEQLSAQLVQAEANARTASLERIRADKLFHEGATTQSDFDNRTDTAIAAEANVEAVRHSLASARARAEESAAKIEQARAHLDEVKSNAPRQEAARRATLAVRTANVELARAALAEAELNRSYATVKAPVDGIIGKKAVHMGNRVSPGQELMALSDTKDLWVTANFRETQLRKMHPGQRVRLEVDALDLDLTGVVASLGGATGSRYSVLPPENATGNYVKVVQRIPVRIELDRQQSGLDRLRPGMSVEPKVVLR